MEPRLPGETASDYAIRMVGAELEAADREDSEIEAQLSRTCTGPSVGALQRRAATLEIKPTALARSLIRTGLLS